MPLLAFIGIGIKAAKKGKPISSDTDAKKVIDEVSDPIKTLSA